MANTHYLHFGYPMAHGGFHRWTDRDWYRIVTTRSINLTFSNCTNIHTTWRIRCRSKHINKTFSMADGGFHRWTDRDWCRIVTTRSINIRPSPMKLQCDFLINLVYSFMCVLPVVLWQQMDHYLFDSIMRCVKIGRPFGSWFIRRKRQSVMTWFTARKTYR